MERRAVVRNLMLGNIIFLFKAGKIPESLKPSQNAKPSESPKPSESTKPEESKKPISEEIPVEKAQDGTIRVQGSRCAIKAAEKALEIAQNICLEETDLTQENSAAQYEKAKEILKECNSLRMQLSDLRFVDEKKEELRLLDKVTITFSIPEGFNPEKVAVARLHEGMKTAEVTKEYTLYETVISDDKKTATIETDQMGTFVIMEIGKEEVLTGELYGDGRVNLGDAQLILKKSLNLIDTWR